MKAISSLRILSLLILFQFGQLNGQDGDSVIDFWYGKEQTFGVGGIVQRYVNILGNVDPDKNIIKLDYALNDGSFQSLSIGPDNRRLQRIGDFNVEIEVDRLKAGENTVVVEAVSESGALFSDSMTLNWAPTQTNPNSTIVWDQVDNLLEVAQPIDGKWLIQDGKVISDPEAFGYDRVLGIGDMGWEEYEVLFPIEIRGIDEGSFKTKESVGPSLLLIMKWMGHTDSPVYCPQPHCGWEPYGGTVSHSWLESGERVWDLATQWGDEGNDFEALDFEFGTEYWVRYRVESKAGGNLYSFKIWGDGLENEPSVWTRQKLSETIDLNSGSFLFVAHHIDLAIGTMQIIPIGNLRNQIVDLLTQNPDVFVQLPYLGLWIVGALWGLAYKRKDPKRGNWIVVAFLILLASGLLGLILENVLPDFFFWEGWFTRRVTYVYIITKFIPIGGHILAGVILFKIFWPSRKTA